MSTAIIHSRDSSGSITEKGAQTVVLAGDTDLDELFSEDLIKRSVFIRVAPAPGVVVKWLETPKATVSAGTAGTTIPDGKILQTSVHLYHFQVSGTGNCTFHFLTADEEIPHAQII